MANPIFYDDISAVNDLVERLGTLKQEFADLGGIVKEAAKDIETSVKNVKTNTVDATKQLDKLSRSAKTLGKQKKQLAQAEDKLSVQLKEVTRLQKQKLRADVREQQKIKEAIRLKNSEAKSIEALMKKTNALVLLRKKLDLSTEKGIAKEKKYRQEIAKNTAQLKKYDSQIGRHQRNVGNYAQALNKLRLRLVAITAAFAGGIMIARRVIRQYAELSDAMADVRKTTGLSWIEVNKLNKAIQQIDTRTSQKELLDLAFVAGKLGVQGRDDILGFVRAADQIGIALGRDLGDVEEAARVIGKLVTLFGVREAFGLEEAMIRTGSAINSLGQSSTATESQIVEFAKRLGGIANQARISIQDILGLGSALDQLGQSPEMSATAITQTIVKLFQNTEKFARIVGLEVKSFSRLLQTDANAALLKFIEALAGSEGGMSRMTQLFNQLGIDGRRAIGVLSALGTNIDVVTEAQRLSNEEFRKATSLAEEAAIKNESLAASIDKTGKAFVRLWHDPQVEQFIKGVFEFARWAIGDYGTRVDQLNRQLEDLAMFEGELWDQRRADLIKERDLLIELTKTEKQRAEFAKQRGKATGAAAAASRGTGLPEIVFEVTDEEKERNRKLAALEKKRKDEELKLILRNANAQSKLYDKIIKEQTKLDAQVWKLKTSSGMASYEEVYDHEIKLITESTAFRQLMQTATAQQAKDLMDWVVDQAKKAARGFKSEILPDEEGELAGLGDMPDFAGDIKPDEILKPEDWAETFATISNYAQQFGGALLSVMDAISQSIQNNLQQELDAVNNRYEAERQQLESLFRSKTISEKEYNTRKLALEKKRNADEVKLKKEAAKKQQAVDLIRAIINTAVAVTSALTAGPIIGVILAIIAAGLGAAEIATIASQKFAKGGHQKLGDKGTTLKGKPHSQGGVDLGEVGTAERGEYMGIINKQATNKYSDVLPLIFDSLNQQRFEKMFSHPLNVRVDSPHSKEMLKEMKKAKPVEAETTVTDTMIITKTGNHTLKTWL